MGNGYCDKCLYINKDVLINKCNKDCNNHNGKDSEFVAENEISKNNEQKNGNGLPKDFENGKIDLNDSKKGEGNKKIIDDNEEDEKSTSEFGGNNKLINLKNDDIKIFEDKKINLEKKNNLSQEELHKKEKELNLIIIEINKKKAEESELKIEIEKLNKMRKEINDFLSQNQQKEKDMENKITTIRSSFGLKEKEFLNQINLLKNQIKIYEQEKSQFNIKNNELIEKEKEIKNREIQLNLRENKIKEKEKELKRREYELQKKENKYKIVLIGLNNIGATCYMNATLQCLSNSKKLTEYFLEQFKKDTNKIMTNEYYEVLKNLWNVESKEKAYSPNSFKEVLSKENPLFAGVAANDSKDLINFLLERFHQELNIINANNNLNNNNNSNFNQPDQTNEIAMLGEFLQEYVQKFNSPISDLFYGILETKSQCQGCNIIKYNFQVYSFLEFPLQQVNQFYFNNGKRPLLTNDGKNPDVDLYECFEYNRKIDLMTGENQMYCNICNKLCNAYYSTILYSGPNYLIINLNRGKGAIYECKVNFPNQLNIFNYVSFKNGITVYELYAVICHLGPSSMSGHFVAYCKNRIDNQWYLYNDGIVTKCSRQFQYNDGMPYILFYRGLSSD